VLDLVMGTPVVGMDLCILYIERAREKIQLAR